VAETPAVWEVIESQMNSLLMPALGVVQEIFACYKNPPFGLKEDDFMNYAMGQFQKRYSRLERAKNATLAEVYQTTNQVIDSDDA
jgi:ribonucleoside-diphosphate reductase beta chain